MLARETQILSDSVWKNPFIKPGYNLATFDQGDLTWEINAKYEIGTKASKNVI